MIAGWELETEISHDDFGTWHVAHRARTYREHLDAAVVWRGRADLQGALTKYGPAAMRAAPPFQRVLTVGQSGVPHLVAERIDAVRARRLLECGRAVPIGAAVHVGLTLAAALSDFRWASGEGPSALLGFGPDQVWFSRDGTRFANPVLAKWSLRSNSLTAEDMVFTGEDLDAVAPETIQGLGHGEEEAEVYSTAYSVLALALGRSPRLRDSLSETCSAIIDGDPRWPEAMTLPPNLRAALRRALDPDPAKRPPTTSSLHAQLTDAAAADGVTVGEGGLQEALEGLTPTVCIAG